LTPKYWKLGANQLQLRYPTLRPGLVYAANNIFTIMLHSIGHIGFIEYIIFYGPTICSLVVHIVCTLFKLFGWKGVEICWSL